MNGKTLYEIVNGSGLSKKEWAKMADISERTLGNLYDHDVINIKYIKKFQIAGLIEGKKEEKKQQPEETYDSVHLLRKHIKMHETVIETQRQLIAVLERENKIYAKLLESNLFSKNKSVPQLEKNK